MDRLGAQPAARQCLQAGSEREWHGGMYEEMCGLPLTKHNPQPCSIRTHTLPASVSGMVNASPFFKMIPAVLGSPPCSMASASAEMRCACSQPAGTPRSSGCSGA